MKILKLLIISVGLVLFSCSNEEFQIEEPRSEPEVRTDNPLSFSFTYQGKEYHSDYILETDSTWILANKEVEELMMKFAEIPTISLLVKEDGSMEYFDNLELLDECLEVKKKNSKITKATANTAFLSVWKDANNEGYWAGYDINFIYTDAGKCAYVGKKLNDEISSFQLYGERVTFYEHSDFQGSNITFVSSTNFSAALNLKALPRILVGKVVGNWNDVISSFIVGQGGPVPPYSPYP